MAMEKKKKNFEQIPTLRCPTLCRFPRQVVKERALPAKPRGEPSFIGSKLEPSWENILRRLFRVYEPQMSASRSARSVQP